MIEPTEVVRAFARRLDGVPDDTPDIAYLGVEMTHGEGRSVRDAIDAILALTPVEGVGERTAFRTIGENWSTVGRLEVPLAMAPRLSDAAKERLRKLGELDAVALIEACKYPMGSRFMYHDEEGEHDPAYVVIPGGEMVPINGYDDGDAPIPTDVARAAFMVTACNAALTASPPVVEEGGREAIAEICYVTPGGAHSLWCDAKVWALKHDDIVTRAVTVAYAKADAILALTPVEGVGEAMAYVRAAGEILAQRSADAPGTPTRDALVMINAALHPMARSLVPGPAEFARVHLAALSTPVAQGDEVREALDDAICRLRGWCSAGEQWSQRGGSLMQLDAFVGTALDELEWRRNPGFADTMAIERPDAKRLEWAIKGIEENLSDELLCDDLGIVLATLTKGARDGG